MSFSQYEKSYFQGAPIELFEFRYGDDPSEIVRLTSADFDVTREGNKYTSIAMDRDSFEDDGNPDDSQQLNIRISRTNPLEEIMRSKAVDKVVTVKIRATHAEDPAQQVIAVWSGRITGVSWEFPNMVIGCERMSTSLKRTGCRARYQRQCRHVHFLAGCNLSRAAYEVTGTVQSTYQNGLEITIPEIEQYTIGYFAGGILESGGTMRYILSSSASTLMINRSVLGLKVGDPVKVYPGCDRSSKTCNEKFNNIENYGGFDYIPITGPFEGNSIV